MASRDALETSEIEIEHVTANGQRGAKLVGPGNALSGPGTREGTSIDFVLTWAAR